MKKRCLLVIMFALAMNLYAIDPALQGEWGLTVNGERREFIKFQLDRLTIMDTEINSDEFTENEDMIYIEDYDGESIVIQYHLLSERKLFFVMWEVNDPLKSITLILSRS